MVRSHFENDQISFVVYFDFFSLEFVYLSFFFLLSNCTQFCKVNFPNENEKLMTFRFNNPGELLLNKLQSRNKWMKSKCMRKRAKNENTESEKCEEGKKQKPKWQSSMSTLNDRKLFSCLRETHSFKFEYRRCNFSFQEKNKKYVQVCCQC